MRILSGRSQSHPDKILEIVQYGQKCLWCVGGIIIFDSEVKEPIMQKFNILSYLETFVENNCTWDILGLHKRIFAGNRSRFQVVGAGYLTITYVLHTYQRITCALLSSYACAVLIYFTLPRTATTLSMTMFSRALPIQRSRLGARLEPIRRGFVTTTSRLREYYYPHP